MPPQPSPRQRTHPAGTGDVGAAATSDDTLCPSPTATTPHTAASPLRRLWAWLTTAWQRGRTGTSKRPHHRFIHGVPGHRLPPVTPMTRRTSWMAAYHTRRLFALTLPASHDTAAYAFKPWHLGARLGRHWAKTQRYSVYAQLVYGVRFLDVRVTQARTGVLWTSHTFLCVPLAEVLRDVARFVAAYPSEVVVVYAVQAWQQPLDWGACREAFQRQLGHTLVPYDMARTQTLGALTAAGKNCVVVSEGMAASSTSTLAAWPKSTLTDYWPNVVEPMALRDCLDAVFERKAKRRDGFFWVKAEVTPDRAFVLSHFFSSSLADLAQVCHCFILDMLHEGTPDLHRSFNVLSTDFVHDHIIAAIIGLNDQGSSDDHEETPTP